MSNQTLSRSYLTALYDINFDIITALPITPRTNNSLIHTHSVSHTHHLLGKKMQEPDALATTEYHRLSCRTGQGRAGTYGYVGRPGQSETQNRVWAPVPDPIPKRRRGRSRWGGDVTSVYTCGR